MVSPSPGRQSSRNVEDAVLTEKLEQAFVQVKQLEKQNGDVKKQLQATEDAASTKIRQLQSELDRQVSGWQNQAAQYRKTNASLESTLNAVTTQLERAYSEKQQKKAVLKVPCNQEHQLTRELEAERKYKDITQKQMRELTTRIHQLEHELKTKEKGELKKVGKELEGVAGLRGELEKAKKNSVNLAVGYRDLEEEFAKMSKAKVELEREIDRVKEGTRERVVLLQKEHSKQLDHTIQTAQKTQVELHALKSKLMQDRAHESARLESRVQSTQSMAQNATRKLMLVQNELQDQQVAADRRVAELQKVIGQQKRQLEQVPYSPEEFDQMAKRVQENKGLRAELLVHVNMVEEMNKQLSDLKRSSAESGAKATALEAELHTQIHTFNNDSSDTHSQLKKVTEDLRQAMFKQNELLEKYHAEQRDNVRLRDELSYTRALTQHEAEVKLGQMSTELKVQQGFTAKQIEALQRQAEVATATAANVKEENTRLKTKLAQLETGLAEERHTHAKGHKVLMSALESERAANNYYQTSTTGSVGNLLRQQDEQQAAEAAPGLPSRPTSAPAGRGRQGRYGRGVAFLNGKNRGGEAPNDELSLASVPPLVETLRKKGLYCNPGMAALKQAAILAGDRACRTALREAITQQLNTAVGAWTRNRAPLQKIAGETTSQQRAQHRQLRQQHFHNLGAEAQLLVFAARATAQPRSLLREAGVRILFRILQTDPTDGAKNNTPIVPDPSQLPLVQLVAEVVVAEGAVTAITKAVVEGDGGGGTDGEELKRNALYVLADILVSAEVMEAVYGAEQLMAPHLVTLGSSHDIQVATGASKCLRAMAHIDAQRLQRSCQAAHTLLTTMAAMMTEPPAADQQQQLQNELLIVTTQALAYLLQGKDGRKEVANWTGGAVRLLLGLLLTPPSGLGPGLEHQVGADDSGGLAYKAPIRLQGGAVESAEAMVLRTYAVRCIAVLSLNAKVKRQLRSGRGPAVLLALVQDSCELEQRKRALQALGNLVQLEKGEGQRLFAEMAGGHHSSGTGNGVDAIVTCLWSTDTTLQRLAFRLISAITTADTGAGAGLPAPEVRAAVHMALPPCRRIVSGESTHPALAEALQIMGSDLRYTLWASTAQDEPEHELMSVEFVSHVVRHVRSPAAEEPTMLTAVEVLSLLLRSSACRAKVLQAGVGIVVDGSSGSSSSGGGGGSSSSSSSQDGHTVGQLVPALLQVSAMDPAKVAEAHRVAAMNALAELCKNPDLLLPQLTMATQQTQEGWAAYYMLNALVKVGHFRRCY
jgi:hypothetical protein